MKRIALFLLMAVSLSCFAQVDEAKPGRILETDTINVAGLGGSDTLVLFRLQNSGPYAIQAVVIDTIEGGAVGMYLKASLDGGTFTLLTSDSVSIDTTAYPHGRFFTGSAFPYSYGGVYIKKNACSEGSVKLFILQK